MDSNHLKTRAMLIALTALIIWASPLSRSQTLDEVLGVGKSDLQESKLETKKLWNDLVTSLEQGNFGDGKVYAQNFVDVVDYTEPYQKDFAQTALELLNATPAMNDALVTKAEAEANAIMGENRTQISSREELLRKLENKKVELQKKVSDANTAGAVVNGLFGAQLGQIANSGTQNAVNDFNINERDIAKVNAEIRELVAAQPQVEQQCREMVEQAKTQSHSADRAQRNKIYVAVQELIQGSNFREAIALSNTALKKLGQDPDLVKLSQSAVDQQKIQKKAYLIAQAASKDATVLIEQGRLWDAKVELERSFAQINERIKDAELLRATGVETAKITRDLSRKIQTATKSLDNALKIANRDAVAGAKLLNEFLEKHPDYPDADAEKLKVADLRTAQVEAKFSKRIAGIEEVIANDPDEAKAMIKRLIADNTDADEVSVIKSRLSKLEKAILQQEIEAIQSKLNEAQSYLSKWNVTYAEDLKKGGAPSASFTSSLSGGIENLTRAISVQEGVVKQIDVLLTEPMDKVSKSQVVGLQETARSALAFMTTTKKEAASNKMLAIVGIVVGFIVIIGGIAFIVLRRKKPAV